MLARACSLATRFHGRDCLGGGCVITIAFSLLLRKIKNADQYSGSGACEDLHIVLEYSSTALSS